MQVVHFARHRENKILYLVEIYNTVNKNCDAEWFNYTLHLLHYIGSNLYISIVHEMTYYK